MTDPKPMDSERLAYLREGLEWNALAAEPPVPHDLVVELLADRDHWHTEATTLRAELADLRLRLDDARASLASMTDVASAAQVELDTAKREADRWREQTLAPALFKIAGDIGLTHSGDDSRDWLIALLGQVGERAREAAALRARCPVEASDVEAAGITWEHVKSWLSANGWSQAGDRFGLAHGPGGPFVHWKRKRSRWVAPDAVCVYTADHAPDIARAVESIARHHERVPLDILDEIAATVPEADRG